jgi:Uncharacterized protein conserved in bacteria
MVITEFEELEKSKFKIYVDHHYAFLLYQKDIDRYELQEGQTISEMLFEKIIEETVFRRAKQKALAVLKFKDRTEQELRDKLIETGYPQEVINRTIDYVTEYGYLNDERYTTAFIRSRMYTKSKMIIKTQLLQKGIKKDMINDIIRAIYDETEADEDAELTAIKKAISKKTKSIDSLTTEHKQKIIASLYRKGFSIDKIRHILK